MSVVDITRPISPQIIANISPQEVQPLDLVLCSNPQYVFIADRFRGLLTADISRPDKFTTCAALKLPGIPTQIHPFSYHGQQLLAIAAGEGGLQMVNVSDPRRPHLVSSFTLGTDYATGVRLSENIAVLANNDDGGMELFAICGGLELKPLWRIATVGYCVSVDVQPPLIAAALRTGGITLLSTDAFARSVSLCRQPNPTVQLLARISRFPDYVQKVALAQPGKLVVANNEHGIQLYDISDPCRPWLEDSLELQGEIVDIRLDGDWIYACAWDGGVAVVRMLND
ncbi:MAG: hypothetical protein N2Z21_00755 [Candidatus Sumerlaeaceae bacterium]|nr:hypothetical protein [Candidatus Sumerlaeaceae bacterium]